MQNLRLPPRYTVSKFTFSQILWADSHRKKTIFKIKFVKCGSSSFSERKIISNCEVREAFLEEVTSELGPKVEAVFACVDYIPAEGAVSVDLMAMESMRMCTSRPGPLG